MITINDKRKACTQYEYIHSAHTPYEGIHDLMEAYEKMSDEEIEERYAIYYRRYYRRGKRKVAKFKMTWFNAVKLTIGAGAILIVSGVIISKLI